MGNRMFGEYGRDDEDRDTRSGQDDRERYERQGRQQRYQGGYRAAFGGSYRGEQEGYGRPQERGFGRESSSYGSSSGGGYRRDYGEEPGGYESQGGYRPYQGGYEPEEYRSGSGWGGARGRSEGPYEEWRQQGPQMRSSGAYGSSFGGYERGRGQGYGGYGAYGRPSYGGGQEYEREGERDFGSRGEGMLDRFREGMRRGGVGEGIKRVFRGPKGYTRSDERIREDVCDRIMQTDWIDATDVEIKVERGEVTLSGTVPDREAKRCLEDVAEEVLGVTDVENKIKVRRAGEQTQGEHVAGSQPVTSGTSGRSEAAKTPRA